MKMAQAERQQWHRLMLKISSRAVGGPCLWPCNDPQSNKCPSVWHLWKCVLEYFFSLFSPKQSKGIIMLQMWKQQEKLYFLYRVMKKGPGRQFSEGTAMQAWLPGFWSLPPRLVKKKKGKKKVKQSSLVSSNLGPGSQTDPWSPLAPRLVQSGNSRKWETILKNKEETGQGHSRCWALV